MAVSPTPLRSGARARRASPSLSIHHVAPDLRNDFFNPLQPPLRQRQMRVAHLKEMRTIIRTDTSSHRRASSTSSTARCTCCFRDGSVTVTASSRRRENARQLRELLGQRFAGHGPRG